MRIPKQLQKKILDRKEKNAFRELKRNSFSVDFFSNDYLGFASSADIEREALALLSQSNLKNGSTGSRLLSGNHKLFERAEDKIKTFHRSEGALLFNSGYDANVGFFSSVPQRGDIVLYDNYIHASIRDGIALSKANSYKFRHNDLEHLKDLLEKFSSPSRSVFVATESVFSMDGDSPDLLAMTDLVESYNAFLVVDEAHALGVFGKKGEGLVQSLMLENRVFARIITYGKALGCHGAAVLAHQEVIDFLINFARSFIYTTAMPPYAVAHLLAAYKALSDTENREKLQRNIRLFKENIYKSFAGGHFIASNSAIQAVIIPHNDNVKRVSQHIQKQGIGVMPILSPTVPEGQERLRICLHSFNTTQEILHLCEIFSTI